MAFRPLDDLPLDQETARRWGAYGRLSPVVDALTEQLQQWLSPDGKAAAEPPRIGLFGGLGQGKSTVLGLCLANIEAKWRASGAWRTSIQDFFCGPPVVTFDISHFKADDLEWRFLTAILWKRIRRNMTRIWLLPGFLLLLCCWGATLVYSGWSFHGCVEAGWSECLAWIQGASPGTWDRMIGVFALSTLAAMVTMYYRLRKLSPTHGLFVTGRDWFMHALATSTWALPKIVLVDDLDRARVEQQRAFLRAMLRFSRQMRFAVVVCLDETELLEAPPAPESPEELLRKVIQFELRLPDRGREDAVALVLAVCSQLAETNPQWVRLLHHPAWLTGLVRCLLLSTAPGGVSPRLVKHLVNDVVLRAEQSHVTDVLDCCALLRLDGLQRLAPGLRRHNLALLAALECNRDEAFQAALELAAVPAARQGAARRFFQRTRMLQPASPDGWFRLVGGVEPESAETREEETRDEDANEDWEPLAPRSHDFFRLFLAAVEYLGAGYPASLDLVPGTRQPGVKGYQFSIPGGDLVHFRQSDLPAAFALAGRAELARQCWMLWVAALAGAEPLARLRIYGAAEAWQTEMASPDGTAPSLDDLLLRERLADSEVWRLLDDTERRRLMGLGTVGPTVQVRDLLLCDLRPEDGREALEALCKAKGNRDFRLAGFWLASVRMSRGAARQGRIFPSDAADVVAQAWPPLQPGEKGWPAALHQAADALVPTGSRFRVPPTSMAVWLAWAPLTTAQCLNILHAAAHPDGEEAWSLPPMAAWLQGDSSALLPAANKKLPAALSAINRDGVLNWSQAEDLSRTQRLTATVLAVFCGWRLPAGLAASLQDVRPGEMRALLEAFFESDVLTGADPWLVRTEADLRAVLFSRAAPEEGPLRRSWQRAIRKALGTAADELYDALGWPPLIELE